MRYLQEVSQNECFEGSLLGLGATFSLWRLPSPSLWGVNLPYVFSGLEKERQQCVWRAHMVHRKYTVDGKWDLGVANDTAAFQIIKEL